MTQERINFEIEADLKRQAMERAEKEDLSLSQYCRRLIRQDVESSVPEQDESQPELTASAR